jgi:hypothetical protein
MMDVEQGHRLSHGPNKTFLTAISHMQAHASLHSSFDALDKYAISPCSTVTGSFTVRTELV